MMRYTISALFATLAGTTAMAEVPRVVTDFAPVTGLVATVMGDLGAPEQLLEQGANAHDFQLRPSQAAALADAGLVVWAGPQMSPWLDRTLEGIGTVPQLRLLEAEGTHLQAFGATHDDHDHDAEHDAENDAAHDEGHDDQAEVGEAHDHSGMDPHAWLDPANGAVWLEVIAAELGRIDPEHAAAYRANAEAGKAGIAALDRDLAAELTPLQGRPFVVFHDAYGYFTAHYGLTLAGAVAYGDATSAGAAHLRDLQQTAGSEALCLFPEAGHDPKLLSQMAEATGVKLGAPLDPEGVAQAPGRDAYLGTLRSLAESLTSCLSAS